MDIEVFLKQIRAFRALSRGEFNAVLSSCAEREFKRKDIVFKEGEPSHWVWLVKRGWVHLIKPSLEGKENIVFTMSPQEILCGVSAFDQGPYAAGGVAATDCILIQIPSKLFVSFLDENAQFCREVLSICSIRIRKMAQKLAEVTDPVSKRIARVLLASLADFEHEIPITHREISQMIGARVETSIRTFRVLREKGLINIKRSRIEITKPMALVQELNHWLESGADHDKHV